MREENPQVPPTVPQALVDDIVHGRIALGASYRALGINPEDLFTYVHFAPFEPKDRYYEAEVSLAFRAAPDRKILVAEPVGANDPDAEDLKLSSYARISTEYYESKLAGGAKDKAKLENKKYSVRLDALIELLQTFPSEVDKLKRDGKQLVAILVPIVAPQGGGSPPKP